MLPTTVIVFLLSPSPLLFSCCFTCRVGQRPRENNRSVSHGTLLQAICLPSLLSSLFQGCYIPATGFSRQYFLNCRPVGPVSCRRGVLPALISTPTICVWATHVPVRALGCVCLQNCPLCTGGGGGSLANRHLKFCRNGNRSQRQIKECSSCVRFINRRKQELYVRRKRGKYVRIRRLF
jgi:hypothetical protein